MALMKAREIPKDAVILNELEATSYAWDIVTKWENLRDSWALRYGPTFLGGLNGLSGVLINRFYRQKMKLSTYGYASSVIPISVMPAMLTGLYHRHSVSTQMLLMKSDICPVCFEMRSAALQLGLGLAYPMVLAPLTSMMLANRYCTYRLPELKEGPKVIFKFLSKLTRPFTGTIATLGVIQFVASSAITYFEMKNNLSIRKKLIEIENRMENNC